MKDNLFVAGQRLAPQHAISRAAGALANCDIPWVKNLFIRWFAQRYQVDMTQAQEENLSAYPTFNAFFTRALKENARPLDSDHTTIISPADGEISQIGNIQQGRIFQAKGQSFSALELLGGDSEEADKFTDGSFATIYLSPRDYHRVHMPSDGTLRKMTFVPGDLFSVNQVTAKKVPRLFSRNERVVCHFDSENGPMAMVLVGAMIVASIETTWAGIVAPMKKRVMVTDYQEKAPIKIARGEEMGRFLLGSTVILLYPKNTLHWSPALKAGSKIKMGELLAHGAE